MVLAGSIILSLKKPLPEEPEAEEVATGDAPIDLEKSGADGSIEKFASSLATGERDDDDDKVDARPRG